VILVAKGEENVLFAAKLLSLNPYVMDVFQNLGIKKVKKN
jgi:hypothetical protein